MGGWVCWSKQHVIHIVCAYVHEFLLHVLYRIMYLCNIQYILTYIHNSCLTDEEDGGSPEETGKTWFVQG